ncbi:MAG TPA: hypothetical protein H9943_07910 [Candidatus Ruthenibacterium avium]|uniref:Uncharacterized protein n=1 Tax=Candidatus Ruthenibacterium avium TaxID=2838751 RepID=A0A9D2M3L2_9FIRM|nr:hypothetical protein [Candidatus Ruthenibacterium avium]
MVKKAEYFLATPAPSGFCALFEQAFFAPEEGMVMLLKGSAGSGKSTLLKKAANMLEDMGLEVERIRCASAPDSLDGILCPAVKLAAFDATAPHVIEPILPGAFEHMVTLYDTVCENELCEQREALWFHEQEAEKYRMRAVRYLTAAGCLLDDTARTARSCTDKPKILRCAASLAKRYLTAPGGTGECEVRLLDAMTPQGVVCLEQTVYALADNVVALEDEWGAAAPVLMEALCRMATSQGLDVVACRDCFSPQQQIRHLIVPSLRLAFVTVGGVYPAPSRVSRTIHAKRFTNMDGIRARRNRLRFNRKSCRDLLSQASEMLRESAAHHAEQERIYTHAMKVEALDERTRQVLEYLRSYAVQKKRG